MLSPGSRKGLARWAVVCLVCLSTTAAQATTADPGQIESRAAAAAEAGDLREAAILYGEAALAWEVAGDASGQFRALLRRGEIERDLGRVRSALDDLERALAIAEASLDPLRVAAARGALGSAWLAAGDTEAAARELALAEELASQSGAHAVQAAVALERGRLFESRGERSEARAAYRRAALAAREIGDASLIFVARVNRAHLAEPTSAGELGAARAAGLHLPATRSNGYAWVRLARSGLRLAAAPGASKPALEGAADSDLDWAVGMARSTGDTGLLSWALGTRSELRARQGRDADALALALEALRAARSARDPDAELRWLTQAGRLEAASGEVDAAIEHLSRAVDLRTERRVAQVSAALAGASPTAGSGDDAYLALADLLLRRAPGRTEARLASADRLLAQATLERLKASELRDYFQDDCVDAYRAKVKNPAAASPGAAVIYPVALAERLELLVSSREGIRQFTVDVPRERFEASVERFAASVRRRASFEFMAAARELDAWLVAPLREHLEALGVDTLVFVPGGKLRTVPMAALHDGERFLVERYALAVTPGLELADPRPLERQGVKVFLGGVSEAVQGYPDLGHVPTELESVRAVFGGEILLDAEFTTEAVERTLDSEEFSIVHIATHGEFGQTAEDTYLLTHDGRLTMDELAESVGAFRYRDKPLDLILLSACETAVGDERAALGLAGIAVKSGARSAIGSLWTVNDEATTVLIQEFYSQLKKPGTSRAEALRRGQMKLLGDLRYRHPGFWSPFLLISNWL